MWGLSRMPASGAALLLNAEAVLTALLAWFVFRENFDRRVAFGMGLIVVGAAVLSWPGDAGFGAVAPALAVVGACLAWAIDNNLTRKVALADARYIAMVKGLAAGATNTALALALGAELPGIRGRGNGRLTRIRRLRHQPRAFRARPAPARHRAHRGVLLHRTFRRRRARSRSPRRDLYLGPRRSSRFSWPGACGCISPSATRTCMRTSPSSTATSTSTTSTIATPMPGRSRRASAIPIRTGTSG